MSFRGDDQRRYGHVPPVQYPVAGMQASNVGRRPSFNSGDDAAYYSQPQEHAPTFAAAQPTTGQDELFLTSPTASHPSSGRGGYASPSSALSGYQHQYQDPGQAPPTPSHATYNPQDFSAAQGGFQRSQSTQLPYHPHPSSRYSAISSNPYAATSPTTTNYTPAAYNPAAYANAPQRQPTYHGYGSSDQSYHAQRPPSSYAQSPASAYSPNFPQHSPGLQQGYQNPQQSPGFQGGNGGYDPSHYTSGGQYAQQDVNGTTTAHYPVSSQAPYPATSQMPVGPNYGAQDRNSFYSRSSRSNSQTSPLNSPPVQPQSSPGLQRHPTRAPLPNRPMDELPEEPRWNAREPAWENDYRYDNATQESIMHDIEAELDRVSPGPSPRPPNGGRSHGEPDQLQRLDSTASSQYMSNTSSLGHASSRGSSNRPLVSQPVYEEDDDDPEGTAGVLAMQQAELEDRRFSSNAFGFDMPAQPAPLSAPLPAQPEEQTQSSDSDFGGIDIAALSGGYPGNLTYGNEYGTSPGQAPPDAARPLPHAPGYFPISNENHERAPALRNAEIDYGGTGGLQPPTTHRLSFDEGEERVSIHSHQSTTGNESPTKDDFQEMFYHPGMSHRPLPRLPPGPESDSSSMLSVNVNRDQNRGYYQHSANLSADSYNPADYDPYNRSVSPGHPERSISMNSHSNTPLVQAPARSRTDAAEERKKLHRQHQMLSQPVSAHPDQDASTPASIGAFDGITLPTGRKKKFVPSKLSAGDFRRCVEPWAFSGIEAWVREMAEGEQDLREKKVEEALINLFVHKVPTMNVADAEALSNRVVSLMLEAGTLEPDEEWVKFGTGHISGVLWQLTGSGCYAPKLHDEEISGRCYSYHCTRTLKKVDLEDPDLVKSTDEWYVYYHLKKEDWETKPKKEVDRQNILHEIVTGEDNYIKQLDIFRTLYRDDLRTRNPPILHPDRRDKFLTAVFGKLDTVLRINKENLLSQLKYRQQEQGPWITGFSDLFREWIRKAKSDYIDYAIGYPRAVYMVRKEQERNLYFKKFLEDKLKHKSSSKHDWTHFLIAPLQRLQRYILLLESVDGKMISESEEKTNLQKAIQEIKAVTMECDAKVEETNKRVEMMELDRMLVLRPGFQSVLNLDHLGRELIIQGELQRMGSKSVRWIDTHALLFDHYLILAKVVKDTKGEKKYDISKEPIPMPLLFLESMNEEPIMKQKGIVAPLGRNVAAQVPSNQLNRVATNGTTRPGLEHSNTSTSLNSLPPLGQSSSNSDEKILYPFKVKHLGHEVYTLYASSARDRVEWCTRIVETKTRHAKALFSQNAEPFRLRVLADAAFHYEPSSMHARAVGVPVKGTPLDRAIADLEGVLGSGQGIAPVCRAQVNCAAGFTAFGKAIIAIGTDYGVFISDPSNPRGWTRTVQATRVTQIAVLEEFSVCLIITDKSLVSYPLDVVAPISDFAPPVNDNPRRAPQRLAKDVTYFATARMKDRMLVFYKRKENLHSMFKVLEPIQNKSTEKKSRLFGVRKGGSGGTDTFRDYDEFFFPTECYSLSLFQSYIAVSTAKGIEMLTLDKKQPMSIPDLKAPSIANIASRIRDQRPLGMFRLNDNEFILTYEDCAVYVDKHGDVSRTLIMEYTGKQKKARSATMYGQYLLLFNDDYVEVRNAENGRLRQIIAGRDVRVLDLGVRGPTGGNATQWEQTYGRNGGMSAIDASKGTVKIAMSHPELQGRQIVLEMLLNDGHTETQ